jgi:hypothetical protein
LVLSVTALAADLPTDEAEAIAYLQGKGLEIKVDAAGHAQRLMSSGKPEMSPQEYQLIGLLTHLEQMGLNDAPLKTDEWAFLHRLPKLKTLSIWHGHHFADLQAFSGLKVESLTIGGCMGLRDLNRDNPDQLRNAILSLRDLPNLKKTSLYHTPLVPDDSHLQHIAAEFKALEDLRIDLAAPRGSETNITPVGLRSLQALPLQVLSLENAGSLAEEHLQAIAGIKSLQGLLIDARRQSGPSKAALEALRRLRPDVEVIVADANDPGPPQWKPRTK